MDCRGFDKKLTVNSPELGEVELALCAAGMRRKEILWVLNFDVYLLGLYCNSFTLFRMQNCIRNNNLSSLCDVILDTDGTGNAPASGNGKPHVALVLRFVRAVDKPTVVLAFEESFAGLPADEIAKFSAELAKRVDDTGVCIDDEIIFYWLQGGGLIITQKGALTPAYSSPIVEKRLLEIYLDTEKGVSKELVNSMLEFAPTIQA